jgi:hypothetical protein
VEKFAGVGIKQVLVLWIVLSLITILVKNVLVKQAPEAGVTKLVLNI